jgi:hypothetical protein
MFNDDFSELVRILKNFGKALIYVAGVIFKSAIFWGVVFLPFIITIIIGVMNTNILWIFCGLIIEIFWALIFIWSDSR